MAPPKKDLNGESEATLYEMLDYFCSRIDFGKSCLDSVSISCMNQLFLKLREQKEKYPI